MNPSSPQSLPHSLLMIQIFFLNTVGVRRNAQQGGRWVRQRGNWQPQDQGTAYNENK